MFFLEAVGEDLDSAFSTFKRQPASWLVGSFHLKSPQWSVLSWYHLSGSYSSASLFLPLRTFVTLESLWIIQGNPPSQGWQTTPSANLPCDRTAQVPGKRMWTGLEAIYHKQHEAKLQLLPTGEHTTFWDGFTVKLPQWKVLSLVQAPCTAVRGILAKWVKQCIRNNVFLDFMTFVIFTRFLKKNLGFVVSSFLTRNINSLVT